MEMRSVERAWPTCRALPACLPANSAAQSTRPHSRRRAHLAKRRPRARVASRSLSLARSTPPDRHGARALVRQRRRCDDRSPVAVDGSTYAHSLPRLGRFRPSLRRAIGKRHFGDDPATVSDPGSYTKAESNQMASFWRKNLAGE